MSVVVGDRLVFSAVSVFLAVVPVLVVTGAGVGFGLRKGQKNFWRKPPCLSDVLPALHMARPASQIRERLVVEHSDALGCEQRYILNDFPVGRLRPAAFRLSFCPNQFYQKEVPLSTILE